ncbi:MAG TPA: NUDIX domain-containing protein [Gemmatimonadaceae bacterium]|nr:NUDIX domain-containing protein [Gemmatimonadaceae bacterium]
MRERVSRAPTRVVPRRALFTVDLVLLAPRGKHLMLLLARAATNGTKERWLLPCDGPKKSESVEAVARRLVRDVVDRDVSWFEQAGAFGDAKRHAVTADVSICFVGVVPAQTQARPGFTWHPIADAALLPPRQLGMLETALVGVRNRMDYAPVAFRLLPEEFTLSELQQTYEMLLGRRLHKASFRRALQAAWLVEPTDEWRSEGRGRPAQLFRYAPRRRRGNRRGVRFDLLSG